MSRSLRQRPLAVAPDFLGGLAAARGVLILTHHNPDGDALGSATAAARALMERGQKAALYLCGAHTDNLDFLLTPEIKLSDLSDIADYDALLLMDCHGFDRLGDGEALLREALAKLPARPPLLIIDHHLPSNGREEGALLHHDVKASSTGELLWEVIKALNVEATPAMADALLAAIVTDTGSFSQSNATPLSLQAAAEIVEAGGELARVNQRLNGGRPARRLRLLAEVMGSLELHLDGRLAVVFITPEMLERSGAGYADSEGFVEMLRSLAGVFLAATIRVTDKGGIKVSLRSREEVDAASLAGRFGGGGHRQAAAYNDRAASTVRDGLKNLLAAAPDFL